jgi:homoserine O-acetyltransferase
VIATARIALSLGVVVGLTRPVRAQPSLPAPRIASLGQCPLMTGAVIPNCRVAYRAFGSLDSAHANTVLIATWLLGRSDDWPALLGAEGLVDTTRYYVLVVDALGDGRSSSPSNTVSSARAAFLDLTVADMVESQYRLLTARLGIRHLRAVLGFSMGGMQAIEWAVRHPSFADKIVTIAGSPRVGAFDRLMWTTMLDEIEDARNRGTPADSVWSRLARLEMLFVQTPLGVNARGVDSVAKDVSTSALQYGAAWHLEDYAAQLRAIRRYDVTQRYGGDMRRVSAEVRARVLAVYSWDDHMVTAGPVAEFARLVKADTLSIRSSCGHVMLFCEQKSVGTAIRAFIAR